MILTKAKINSSSDFKYNPSRRKQLNRQINDTIKEMKEEARAELKSHGFSKRNIDEILSAFEKVARDMVRDFKLVMKEEKKSKSKVK